MVISKVMISFIKNKCAVAVFLDTSKTFDKVWHHGLLYQVKLQQTENSTLNKTNMSIKRYLGYRKPVFRDHFSTFCTPQIFLSGKCKININEQNLVHTIFSFRKHANPTLYLNSIQIPISKTVKYLGLDFRLKINVENISSKL